MRPLAFSRGIGETNTQSRTRGRVMVFAVQCPEPRCRKFMLVEEHDRGKVVPCLICKTAIRVGDSTAPPPLPEPPPKPKIRPIGRYAN